MIPSLRLYILSFSILSLLLCLYFSHLLHFFSLWSSQNLLNVLSKTVLQIILSVFFLWFSNMPSVLKYFSLFLSPPFLFCSSFQLHCLLSGVFIGAGGAGATLPLSSHGDRVGWLGQPLCKRPSRPQGMAPLSTLHHGGRWGVGCVRVWTSEERDRGKT